MTVPPVRRVSFWAAFGLVAALGCGPEPIRSYEVPKPPETPTPEPTPDGPAKVRLLGAIIPVGEGQSRFIKFSGPVEKIDPHEKAFDAFLNSVRVSDDPKNPVTFTPPPTAKPGPPRAMRLVTFQFGEGEKSAELYISDPFGGSVLENVNRWRDEVGLKRVIPAELPKVTTEVTLGTVKAYKVDFRGPGGKGGMRPPFAGQ
jgi:hypothetical protein